MVFLILAERIGFDSAFQTSKEDQEEREGAILS